MQPHAQRRLSDGPDRRAAPTHLLFETPRRIPHRPPKNAGGAHLCYRLRHSDTVNSVCVFESGSSPVPEGSSFPRLHQAPGLRRFSPLFYGSCASVQFFFDTLCTSCLRILAGRRAADPGLKGHMHSEDRIICRVSRHLLRRATSFQRPLHTPS